MRKFALMGSLVALVMLVSASSALAVTQTFTVTTNPSKLKTSTSDEKSGATLAFKGGLADFGDIPPYASGVEVAFGQAWGINKDAVKTDCSMSSLSANGTCPSDTLIASGTATAIARPLIADPITAPVQFYATTGSHALDFIVYAKTTTPIETTITLPGWVTTTGLPKITIDASGLPTPLGQKIYVEGFNATTKSYTETKKVKKRVKGKVKSVVTKIPFSYAPIKCSGKFSYTATTSFADAPPVSVAANSPCKQTKDKTASKASKKNKK